MAEFLRSLRIAARTLFTRRGLAAARIITVALVVASVAAVFTVVNATLLRPLPFPDGDRLVRVYFQPPGTTAFSAADSLDAHAFVTFRAAVRSLDAMVGIFVVDRGVAGITGPEPESVLAGRVT